MAGEHGPWRWASGSVAPFLDGVTGTIGHESLDKKRLGK